MRARILGGIAVVLSLAVAGCGGTEASGEPVKAGMSTPANFKWSAFTVPAKSEEAARAMVAQLVSRKAELSEHGKRTGNSEEFVFLQQTPDGASFVILQNAAPDHMQKFVDSQHQFDKWLLGQIQETTGVDFAKMLADPKFKPNEQVFHSTYGESTTAKTHVFAVPILEGKTEEWKKLCAMFANEKKAEMVAARAKVGMVEEAAWLQHTPNGDFAVILHRAEDPASIMPAMMSSQEPFDVWFRENVLPVHGMDKAPEGEKRAPNELLLNWKWN